jgi:hypothetical protein
MGTDMGSHITGNSVHNLRIERLWREVNRIVCRPYRNVFLYLESEQLLDPLELWCLHQVYTSRINRSLQEFCQQMNNHPIRTEGNLSPNQLFVRGVLASEHWTRSILEDVIDPSRYGIEDGTPPHEDDTSAVVCNPPNLRFTLSATQETEVRQTIENTHADDFGVSEYLAILQLVRGFGALH